MKIESDMFKSHDWEHPTTSRTNRCKVCGCFDEMIDDLHDVWFRPRPNRRRYVNQSFCEEAIVIMVLES